MMLALQIIAVWTIGNFVVGVPAWMWLMRRNRIEERRGQRWLAAHPGMSLSRRPL